MNFKEYFIVLFSFIIIFFLCCVSTRCICFTQIVWLYKPVDLPKFEKNDFKHNYQIFETAWAWKGITSFILFTEMLRKSLFPFWKKTLQKIKTFMFRILEYLVLILFSSVCHLRLTPTHQGFPQVIFPSYFNIFLASLHAPMQAYVHTSHYGYFIRTILLWTLLFIRMGFSCKIEGGEGGGSIDYRRRGKNFFHY